MSYNPEIPKNRYDNYGDREWTRLEKDGHGELLYHVHFDFYIFPLFDYLSQSLVATISTVIFFIWSYIRSYIVRRYFNKRVDSDK